MDEFLNILQPHIEIMVSNDLETNDTFNVFGIVSLKALRGRLRYSDLVKDEDVKKFITAKYSEEMSGVIEYI